MPDTARPIARAGTVGGSTAVLAVAYHKPESLRRLLEQITCPVHIVNVEADPAVAAVARDHGARLIDLPGNPGFAGAVNAGASQIESEVVVILNDDVVIGQESLDRLALAVRNGADVAGPRLVGPTGHPETSVIGLPNPAQVILTVLLPDRPVRGLRWLPVAKWTRMDESARVPGLTGAVLAVRTALLRSTPMPEDYFMYWEEVEWFWRLRRAGARVEFRSDAVAVHAGGRSEVQPFKARQLSRNAIRCVRRTNGRAAAAMAWSVVTLGAGRLLMVDMVRLSLGRVATRRVAARWAGLVAALRALGEIR